MHSQSLYETIPTQPSACESSKALVLEELMRETHAKPVGVKERIAQESKYEHFSNLSQFRNKYLTKKLKAKAPRIVNQSLDLDKL